MKKALEDALFDAWASNNFLLVAFMKQLARELARLQPEPDKWIESFINETHKRLDELEVGDEEGIRLMAQSRDMLDQLGTSLQVGVLEDSVGLGRAGAGSGRPKPRKD